MQKRNGEPTGRWTSSSGRGTNEVGMVSTPVESNSLEDQSGSSFTSYPKKNPIIIVYSFKKFDE